MIDEEILMNKVPATIALARMYKSCPCRSIYCLVSIKSPYQVIHPLPFLISALAYARQEQLLKHFCSHASRLIFLSNSTLEVSGIFTFSILTNPSPFLHMDGAPCCLLHPPDSSLNFQSCGKVGSYPGKHAPFHPVSRVHIANSKRATLTILVTDICWC